MFEVLGGKSKTTPKDLEVKKLLCPLRVYFVYTQNESWPRYGKSLIKPVASSIFSFLTYLKKVRAPLKLLKWPRAVEAQRGPETNTRIGSA